MVNFTIKGIPKDLHKRLKAKAKLNRRSINSEILAQLETGTRTEEEEREAAFKAADEFREKFKIKGFSLEELDKAINEGRE